MSTAIGANPVDMKNVQVHPTGLVDPNEPDAKVKFLAAEALRGVGGLLLNADGKRFCDELGTRDYVTGEMWKGKGPFRLVLNAAGSKDIEWHCKHYVGRGLMKKFANGGELAKDMGLPKSVIEETFKQYNDIATKKNDPFGKKFFTHLPFDINDEFNVAIVTPVVHYCMGGLEVQADASVVGKNGNIVGLYAAGEVMGGVHGVNRLGGSSLLDCVVFGRVAGENAAQKAKSMKVPGAAAQSINTGSGNKVILNVSGTGVHTQINAIPGQNRVLLTISWGDNTQMVSVPTGGKL